MKFLHRLRILFGLLFLSISITSCKKNVQIGTPSVLLVSSAVFNDNTTATAAQTAIYSQMNNNQESYYMAIRSGLLSDELINYAVSGDNRQYYQNAMTAAVPNQFGPWQKAYNYIYQANAVQEGLQNNHGVSPAVSQQLSGEAKFVRAFWHFYLTNCYGDVPLVTTTNYALNALLPRTPQSQVYDQIIKDLKDAQGLLNRNYIDFNNNTGTNERTRPTYWAATALLARVYLYTKKYDLAEKTATELIENAGMFRLEGDLNNVFLSNSQEAIWQIQIPTPNNGVATRDGLNFILRAAPSGVNVSISSQLLKRFAPGDLRRNNWVRDTIIAGKTFSYAYKYKQGTNVSVVKEYGMALRLAEQCLIRAESRVWLNNTSGGLDDLNAIRHRAGLGDYVGSTEQASLLQAILNERQVELFTEWGHRWFDLIRTGNITAVMNIVTPIKGGVWNSDGHQALYPIAQSQRGRDLSLSQNVGY